MSAFPAQVPVPLELTSAWGGRGRVSDLGGPVHWVDFGGPPDAVPLVLVHGLGGSHLNWVQVGPRLATRHRVAALDLNGFGLTPGEGRDATIRGNASLVARFVREVVGEPAVLVGNSMGGMVSLVVASTEPDLVLALVLIDPSLPLPRQRPDAAVALQFMLYATPWVGERYVSLVNQRVTDRQFVEAMVSLCFADPSRADRAVLQAGVELSAHRRRQPGQGIAFLGAARSLLRMLRRPVAYRALMRGIDQPVLLIHGEADRLVPVAAARQAAADNPGWDVELLPGVGHTPQLEVPEQVLDLVLPWLERHGSRSPTGRA